MSVVYHFDILLVDNVLMTQWLRVLWPVGYAGKFAHLLFFCHKSGMVMPQAGNLQQFVRGKWLEINGCTIADRTMLWLYQDSAMNVLRMIVLMVVHGCFLWLCLVVRLYQDPARPILHSGEKSHSLLLPFSPSPSPPTWMSSISGKLYHGWGGD